MTTEVPEATLSLGVFLLATPTLLPPMPQFFRPSHLAAPIVLQQSAAIPGALIKVHASKNLLQLERVEADDSRLFRTTTTVCLKHRQSSINPTKLGIIGFSHGAESRDKLRGSLSIFTDPRLCGSVVDSCRPAQTLNDICQRVSYIARHLFLGRLTVPDRVATTGVSIWTNLQLILHKAGTGMTRPPAIVLYQVSRC